MNKKLKEKIKQHKIQRFKNRVQIDSDDSYESDDSDVQEIRRKAKVPKNTWIIKPGENTNRGNGIEVCSSL